MLTAKSSMNHNFHSQCCYSTLAGLAANFTIPSWDVVAVPLPLQSYLIQYNYISNAILVSSDLFPSAGACLHQLYTVCEGCSWPDPVFSFLQEVSRQLFLECVELEGQRERVLWAYTLQGRFFNVMGYFFSMYCSWKIFIVSYTIDCCGLQQYIKSTSLVLYLENR